MAQDKVRSITIGVSPFGFNSANISLDSEDYTYHYKSYWNVNMGYERQLRGVIALTELSYSHAAFDEYDLNGHSEWFNEAQTEGLTSVALTFYAGKTILPNRRLQIPLYIGAGAEYLKGGPLHNLAFDIAAKARVKFYVNDNIAIFVGANGRYGFGSKSASEESYSSKKKYSIGATNISFDAGISIGL